MSSAKEGGLKRSFGLKMAIIIVMSTIIGSGIFKKVAPMAEALHSPTLVVLAWVLAGLIVLFGALSIAELGALFPHSGGPLLWLDKIYGKTISFLYGWASFTVIQTAAISSIAYVFAGAVHSFVDLPHFPPHLEAITVLGILQPFDNIGAKLVACILIVVLTIINIKGARQGGYVSLFFTLIITLCIVVVTCIALSSAIGSMHTFTTVSHNYPASGFTFFGLFGVMIIAMRNAFWGYEGWITVSFIGEELKDASRTLPRAMITGLLLVIGLYAIINFSYLYVMPIDQMLTEVNANPNNIAAVVVINHLLGSGGVYVVSAMILVSTFGCTNATILVSSRVYYAMAQDGMFFKNAAQCHPKYNTPYKSLTYQGIWACILVISGSFDLLTDLIVIAAFVFYGLIVFGVILMRRRNKEAPRLYKTLGYPVIPLIFIAFCMILLVVSFLESPVKSLMGFGLILSGLPFLYYWRNQR